ncbi:transporter substrate-binding domain-containing protein [Parashewanella tropica]|uniref:transporter substrate-binding domain-containing protein n=1 Tax=Parashewanella tropica TaxID=2547970 RepID=UPI0014790165|nr:transporter substrate-binding domain-containing protein [Parashewanella tropica]
MKNQLRICFILLCSLCAFNVHTTEKPISIAISDDAYPYFFVDEQGEAAGYFVDLWKAWSNQVNRPVHFVATSLKGAINGVKYGDIDVHAGLAKINKHQHLFQYSLQIGSLDTFLYKHEKINTESDLEKVKPYSVGIVNGSLIPPVFNKYSTNYSYKRFPNYSKLINAALNGSVLVFAANRIDLQDVSKQEEFNRLFPSDKRLKLESVPIYAAVRKGKTDLLMQINEGFKLLNSEVKQDIHNKWLGENNHRAQITVALPANYNPLSTIGDDNLPYGMYVDMWREWSNKVKSPVKFEFMDTAEAMSALKSGIIDVALHDISQDELTVAWRLYEMKHRLFMFQKKLPSLDNLKNTRIGVIGEIKYSEALKRKLPNSKIVKYQNIDAALKAAEQKKIVGFIAPTAWAQNYLLKNKHWANFVQEPSVEFVSPVYVLVQKNNVGLTNKISRGFNLLSYKKLASIEKKWILNPDDHFYISDGEVLNISLKQKQYLATINSLKFGYLKKWAPMEFIDEEGQFQGINADIVSLINKQLNIPIEAVAYDDWVSLYKALQAKEIDFVGSMASRKDESGLHFTKDYWPSPWAITTKSEHSGLLNLDQLQNSKVAIVEGYALSSRLIQNRPDLKFTIVADSEKGVQLVEEDKADYFIDKLISLSSLINDKEYYDLKVSLIPGLEVQRSHFGVSDDFEPLVPLIDLVIAQMDQSTKNAIYKRWVPDANVSHAYVYRRWVIILSIITVILSLTFLMYWLANKRIQLEVNRREKVEKKIHFLNNHDNLTGLVNRRLLDDRLTNAVLSNSREQTRFAVMFIGIGNFRMVNEALGYSAGDSLLVGIANALSGTIRRSDTLARFSSDEFVIILNRAQEFEAVCQVAENILAASGRVIEAQVPDIPLTVNIGIAFYPNDSDNPIELLKQADRLMTLAKESNESSYMTS